MVEPLRSLSFSNFSGLQTSQKSGSFRRLKGNHNYSECAPALRLRTDSIRDVSAGLRTGKVPYRSRAVGRSSQKIVSDTRCVELNSRAPFEGVTASFWSLTGEDAALRLQAKKVREKSTRVRVRLVHFQHSEIYIQVETKLHRRRLTSRPKISFVTPIQSTMWT